LFLGGGWTARFWFQDPETGRSDFGHQVSGYLEAEAGDFLWKKASLRAFCFNILKPASPNSAVFGFRILKQALAVCVGKTGEGAFFASTS
jgi:hypothetical protein|tara:strand:+ start:330 stop:599 length:270 start_codon:yes stop_codon:yes gene_type:complete